MLPELRRRFRLQVREFGQSRSESSRTAVRACSTRKSSFPAAASLVISRSHSSSASSNQASSSSRSAVEKRASRPLDLLNRTHQDQNIVSIRSSQNRFSFASLSTLNN